LWLSQRETLESNYRDPTEKPSPGNFVNNKTYGLESSKKVTPNTPSKCKNIKSGLLDGSNMLVN